MRQTDLSFEELLQELDNMTSVYPRCLLINEIGGILEAGGEEANKAAAFLRQLLNSENPYDKFLAYCYLSTNNFDEVTFIVLEAFANNLQNAEIVLRARMAIRSRNTPNN